MSRAWIAIFILFASLGSRADLPEDVKLKWSPKCKEATLEHWTRVFTSCMDVLPEKKSCSCVADGLVQKPDCARLKSLSENQTEREKYEKNLAKSCRQKRRAT